MKDWLGQEYGPGDYVTYAQVNGRSANIIVGQVDSFTDKGNVKVIPITGSRWKGHSAKKYVDSRTGKGIDPSFKKHQTRESGYTHKTTGEFFTHDQIYRLHYPNLDEVRAWEQANPNWWYNNRYGANNDRPRLKGDPNFNRSDYEYTEPLYKDYVELRSNMPTVTLIITANITKVPSEVVEAWVAAQDAKES